MQSKPALLSPPTKKLVEKMLANGEKSFSGVTPQDVRKFIDSTAHMAGKPEPVKEIIRRTVKCPHGDVPIVIYTPERQRTDAMVIYTGGSGYLHGNEIQHDVFCRRLTNMSGCRIIRVIYRSAPEWKYPAGLNDSYEVLKWVFQHAGELDTNENKIAVCGESSGGNFAALMAIRARNEKLPLACQMLIAPSLDLSCSKPSHTTYASGYLTDADSIEAMLSWYLPEDAYPKDPNISPLWEPNLKGLAPTLIINAECDPLVDEGREYANRLVTAGVDVKYSLYKGQIHGFFFFRGELEEEENPYEEIAQYIKNRLT